MVKLPDRGIDQSLHRLLFLLRGAISTPDTERKNLRLMVAYRHFQGLMKMLTCDKNDTDGTPPYGTPKISTQSTTTPSMSRSSQYYSTNNEESRARSLRCTPIKRPNTIEYQNNFGNHQSFVSCYNQIPVINVGAAGSPTYGLNRSLIKSNSSIKNNLHITENNDVLKGYVHQNRLSPRAFEINRRQAVKSKSAIKNDASPVAEQEDVIRGYVKHNQPSSRTFDKEFSRYKPLPAINSIENRSQKKYENGDYLEKITNRKLKRQLTYKVLKPVFVKGPSDVKSLKSRSSNSATNGSSNLDVDKLHRNQFKHQQRNRTVVIRHGNGEHKKTGSKSMNAQTIGDEAFGYDSGGTVSAVQNNEPLAAQSIKHRLTVRKDLIEAGEKLKKGLSSHDSAFWFEM